MTQEDVAERLGIRLSTYAQWEAAASLPADALERVASALCVLLDQLSV
ncbi:helix-turn-helix domain-containing protein [Pseudomonas sp. MOB-449]|nr:helix-turn-helix domain-containing protein [Pseudomonas sp. MOB-449]